MNAAVVDIPRYRALTTVEIAHYLRETGKAYKWILEESFSYYSERYNQFVYCKKGMLSDGATGAMDIVSAGWWVHDQLCIDGHWAEGTPLTNWQASMVLADILYTEGRTWRSKYWFWATFALGGDKARENGMFRL